MHVRSSGIQERLLSKGTYSHLVCYVWGYGRNRDLFPFNSLYIIETIEQFSLYYRKDMPDVLYGIYSLGHPPHIAQKSASLHRSLIDVKGRGCRRHRVIIQVQFMAQS